MPSTSPITRSILRMHPPKIAHGRAAPNSGDQPHSALCEAAAFPTSPSWTFTQRPRLSNARSAATEKTPHRKADAISRDITKSGEQPYKNAPLREAPTSAGDPSRLYNLYDDTPTGPILGSCLKRADLKRGAHETRPQRSVQRPHLDAGGSRRPSRRNVVVLCL